LFDNEKHRLESSIQKLKLGGTLKIDIGGLESDMELAQEQTTISYTSDTSPLCAKKQLRKDV
jgi:hypothetical protein